MLSDVIGCRNDIVRVKFQTITLYKYEKVMLPIDKP